MAKTEVGAKVEIEFKSVGELRKSIKDATNDLLAMQQAFGKTSPEAIEAGKRVAELQSKIRSLQKQTELLDPSKKFAVLGATLESATAGFTALQGVMGLFGSESKDLEKTLVKVQSAMALQQGISGIMGAMTSMKSLAGTIKTQVVTAFSTLRGAIIATGLGALAVAIGLVIANFDTFKKAIFNLIPGLKGIADFVGSLVTKFTDFVGITSEAERNLEKLTKANVRANESIDQQIKLLSAQGGKEDEIYKLKKQRAENELVTLRENLKVKGKLTDEELKQFRDLKNEQQVLDAEEVTRKNKIAEDEAKRLEEQRKKDAEKRKQDAEKKKQEEEAEQKRREELVKAENERIRNNAKVRQELEDQLLLSSIKNEEERTKKENEIKLRNQLDAEYERYRKGEIGLKEYFANRQIIQQTFDNEEKARNEKKIQEDLVIESDKLLKDAENDQLTFEERLAKIQERQALESQLVFASEDDRKKFIAENEKAITDVKLLEAQARVNNAQFAADQLSAIASLAGQDTAAGKALSVAAATISTYLSAQKAYESQFKPVAIVDSPIRGAIAAAVAVATGIANVRKILAVPVPNRGGGGGSVPQISGTPPIPATLPPTATAQLVNAQAINNLGNQATRAYVLNSDIQNNDQRNAYLQRNARLG